MKKSVLVLSFIFLLASFPGNSSAMDYMLGVKAGYFSWQPLWADVGGGGTLADVDRGDGVLYGPIISLIFTPQISLSFSGLMGEQKTHWNSRFSPSASSDISGNYNFDVFRADFDTVLSYRVGSSFRVFAGYKYLYMKTSMDMTEIRTDGSGVIQEVDISSMEGKHYGHGPALGFGYAYPLSNTFFASLTVSGVYLWGDFSMESNERYQLSGGVITQSTPDTFSGKPMRHMGINIEPAIGMSPGEGMPIVTLGLRYQHFRIKIEDTEGMLPEKWYDDTMIGFFVSVVYMF